MKSIHCASIQDGYSLVEVLISIAVFSVILYAAASVFTVSQEASRIAHNKSKAVFYMRDYIEKLKNIRRDNWESLTNGRYLIKEDATAGTLLLEASATGENIDGYTRYVDIQDAYRDAIGVLVETPGLLDPSTKKITINVSWSGMRPGHIEESMYLTRYLDNLAWIQTTEADFNAGTHTATTTVNNSGGEVILGAGGAGDWCNPSAYVVEELDFPPPGSPRKVTAYEGKAFSGTDTFFTGNFFEIDITNTDPPQASISSSIPGYSTNDVFIQGNYAYVAVDDPFNWIGRDVVIIDLTTNTEVGYFNTNSWFGAQGVYVVGDVGYVTTGAYLRSFDLSSKTGSRPQLDAVRLGTGWFWWLAHSYRFQVKGNYAYVALDWSSAELRLVNVSDPKNMYKGARADVNGADGKEVFVNDSGTRAYLATSQSGSKDEFFIINTDFSDSDKNNVSFNFPVISSFDSGNMNPRGLVVVPGNRAILVGTGGEEYQVIDTTDENNPVKCGGVEINGGVYGVAAVLEGDGDAYSYIVTGDGDNEFKIIKGGPGGAYAATGIFESQTLDTSYATAFNYIDVTDSTPANTTITYQVAGVDTGVSGTCIDADFSDLNFVGPDGTSTSFFSDDGGIPLDNDGIGYENPARCFRFRAYLSTDDFFITPTLFDVTVNYSP